MDAFGTVVAKPEVEADAIGPIYQEPISFSLYHEELDRDIGNVEVAPYAGFLGEEFVELELEEELEGADLQIAMEHAEEAISDFYSRNFPSISQEYSADLGLVEQAERYLEEQQERGDAIYDF